MGKFPDVKWRCKLADKVTSLFSAITILVMVGESHLATKAECNTPFGIKCMPLASMRVLFRCIDRFLPLVVIAFIGWGFYLVTFEVGCTS